MQKDPKKRLIVAKYLENPWIITYNNSNSLLVQKRNRLLILSTKLVFKKVVQRTLRDSFTTNKYILIINAILANKLEYQNGSS